MTDGETDRQKYVFVIGVPVKTSVDKCSVVRHGCSWIIGRYNKG